MPVANPHMKTVCAACLWAIAGQPLLADDMEPGLAISTEVEIGVEAVVSADDPDAEVSDVYLSIELEAEAALTPNLGFFTSLTLESVTDAEEDRAFEDIGLYVGTLGLSYTFEPVTVIAGKFNPAFGSAWDTAPGEFGTNFAEDYELEEMLGLAAEIELGDGVLTFSAFYPDDTVLSDSLGTQRGRNRTSEGEVGNTGQLNNFALQYDHDFEQTSLHLGALHLSRGEEDVDQNGFALGVTHRLSQDIDLMAEAAYFDGWEGEERTASLATLGASYTQGPLTLSLAIAQRDVSGAPTDRLLAVGADYSFDNDIVLSTAFARVREEGEDSNLVSVLFTVTFE
ncbi:MAG: hypothetical protein AAF943_15860 [Pseudomonadota bacterium]